MKVSQLIKLAKAHMEAYGDTPVECVSSGVEAQHFQRITGVRSPVRIESGAFLCIVYDKES